MMAGGCTARKGDVMACGCAARKGYVMAVWVCS